jgi:dipeptidyl aminopeptidase/acylaminoacyl peptidase
MFKYILVYCLIACITLKCFSQSSLGVFDSNGDIGKVNLKGSANFIPQTNQYLVSGSGYNIWFHRDEFHLVWKKMKGDFILYARGGLVGRGVDPHRKSGWMIRTSLDENAPHVSLAVHGDGLTSLQYRKAGGGETGEIKSTVTNADVIQLERTGFVYTIRVAEFGKPFVVEEVKDVDIGDEVYVGLFVNSHHPDVVESAVFSDVRIIKTAPEGFVQYRQYLGSHIELLNITSGDREIVFTSPNSLQAPNWTPDGNTLIYNSNGFIYTFDLATREPKELFTGNVRNNNNDHVLSFDGKMLGLSSGVQSLGGSIIYTVPVTGGVPKQITPRGPSYLHGWSPDGKYLVFTGERNKEFDIYKIPSKGGKEIRLTTSPGLDDGSEYTPDGKYIYFNSARTGTMQLWRMDADGSNQEPVTHGDFHDWFPHISPDGKWIVFLSFLKEEVKAEDHPFYKHVYLRLLPIEGGKPKVIAYFFGGQGSINTPSWSPDSKRVAFVTNTDLTQ